MAKSNIIKDVVATDLCIGCGVCAGVCPHESLAMQFNRYGELVPTQVKNCHEGCELCSFVCPFFEQSDNEDKLGHDLFGGLKGIHHTSEIGYYLSLFVGYVPPFFLGGGVGTNKDTR